MFGRRGRLATAALIGVVMAMGLSLPVSAAVIVTDTGTHGDFHIFDSAGFPGATCGYGAPNSSGVAYFKWMKVAGPSVQAANVTGGVDHQTVSFQFKLQREIGMGSWKTVASSARQSKTAYDNSWTEFAPLKVYWNGAANQYFRAITIIRWTRNGSVDGLVNAQIQYYEAKWTVGSPGYVFPDAACWGSSD